MRKGFGFFWPDLTFKPLQYQMRQSWLHSLSLFHFVKLYKSSSISFCHYTFTELLQYMSFQIAEGNQSSSETQDRIKDIYCVAGMKSPESRFSVWLYKQTEENVIQTVGSHEETIRDGGRWLYSYFFFSLDVCTTRRNMFQSPCCPHSVPLAFR